MSDFIMEEPQPEPGVPDLGPYIDLPLQAPRRVRIGRGGNWIYDGFGLFNRGMGVSAGICLFSLVLSIGSAVIPGANLLYMLFSMVLAAGYMMVAHNAFRYGSIRFNDFFEGFRHQMGQLVLAEVIYFAISLGVILFVVLGGALTIGLGSSFSGLDNVETLLLVLFWSLVLVALMTATAISFVGIIGFVGLVAPHIGRMLIGEDQRFLIPLSALCGAAMLSVSSVISKSIVPGALFPIGIVTAIIGVPFFIWLILGRGRKHA